jgi:riboflavin synthase
MFTGIIESTGKVTKVKSEENNLRITVQCIFTEELKVDQSISHNGVCLTVVNITGNEYEVVAIDETLKRTNFSKIKVGNEINLERSVKVGDRLDGHIVQGHVDDVAKVDRIISQEGSWLFYFTYENSENITVEKGSVCVNGISLTVVDSGKNNFSVAVIPYTYDNTNLKNLSEGDIVNIEFDIVGKYVRKLANQLIS